MGEAVGIDVRAGKQYDLGGVTQGMRSTYYFHPVKLYIAGSYIETMVGFSYDVSVAGLFGYLGFFDNFIVTFDDTPHPPQFGIERITSQ